MIDGYVLIVVYFGFVRLERDKGGVYGSLIFVVCDVSEFDIGVDGKIVSLELFVLI